MKKLFLFFASASLCLTACSDDDKKDNQGGTVSFTINGEEKTLTLRGIFESRVYPTGNEDYRSAFAVNEEEHIAVRITFPINKDHAPQGDGSIEYIDNGNEFYALGVTVNYTENSSHKLKGTFSGTFSNGMNPPDEQTRTVSNGTFDIDR